MLSWDGGGGVGQVSGTKCLGEGRGGEHCACDMLWGQHWRKVFMS